MLLRFSFYRHPEAVVENPRYTLDRDSSVPKTFDLTMHTGPMVNLLPQIILLDTFMNIIQYPISHRYPQIFMQLDFFLSSMVWYFYICGPVFPYLRTGITIICGLVFVYLWSYVFLSVACYAYVYGLVFLYSGPDISHSMV